jgi:ubiquitin C-terminal hydrolase
MHLWHIHLSLDKSLLSSSFMGFDASFEALRFCRLTQTAAPIINKLPIRLAAGGRVPQTTRSMIREKMI